jgi:betaine-aldehyde dehydrogenase
MELVKRLSNRQFIDGEWVDSSNKNTRDIINPYNQEVIFTVAEGTKEDVERAILAARRSFEDGELSSETSEVRGQKVRAIADKIKEPESNVVAKNKNAEIKNRTIVIVGNGK